MDNKKNTGRLNSQHVVVIGLGTLGKEIALSLMQSGFTVCGIDHDPDIIDSMEDKISDALVMDTTQESSLNDLPFEVIDTVIVAIGNESLENSILTTALLKQMGVGKVIARATSRLHARILKQVGADWVFNPEEEMGRRLAKVIAKPGFLEMYTLHDDICIAQIALPENYRGRDQSLRDTNIRKEFNVNVLGILRLEEESLLSRYGRNEHEPDASANPAHDEKKRMRRKLIYNISPDHKLKDDDILIILGKEADIDRLRL